MKRQLLRSTAGAALLMLLMSCFMLLAQDLTEGGQPATADTSEWEEHSRSVTWLVTYDSDAISTVSRALKFALDLQRVDSLFGELMGEMGIVLAEDDHISLRTTNINPVASEVLICGIQLTYKAPKSKGKDWGDIISKRLQTHVRQSLNELQDAANRSTLSQLDKKLDEILEQLALAWREHRENASTLERVKGHIEPLRRQRDQLLAAIAERELDRAQLKAKRHALRDELSRLRDSADQSGADVEQQSSNSEPNQQEERNTVVQELERLVDLLEEAVTATNNQFALGKESQTSVLQAQQRLIEARVQLAQARQQREPHSAQRAQDGRRSRINNELADVQHQVRMTDHMLERMHERAQRLEGKLRDLARNGGTAERELRIELIENRIRTLQEQITQLESERRNAEPRPATVRVTNNQGVR